MPKHDQRAQKSKRPKKTIAKQKHKKDLPKGPTAKDFALKFKELAHKFEKEGDEEAERILDDLRQFEYRPQPWTNARARKKWYLKWGISWSPEESSEFTPTETVAYKKWCRSGIE